MIDFVVTSSDLVSIDLDTLSKRGADKLVSWVRWQGRLPDRLLN